MIATTFYKITEESFNRYLTSCSVCVKNFISLISNTFGLCRVLCKYLLLVDVFMFEVTQNLLDSQSLPCI